MHKIWIIVKSEFWRRVTAKGFIAITLLAPVLMLALILLPAVLGFLGAQGEATRVMVVDETGRLLSNLQEEAGESLTLLSGDVPLDSVRAAVRAGAYDGYLHLPAGLLHGEGEAAYYSAEGSGLSLRARLQQIVEKAVETQRLADVQAPPQVQAILQEDVPLRMVKLTDEGEETDSAIAFSILGYIMGFFIYIAVLAYGSVVMLGVIEEKASRVVEVMVSSVRPFQLLMGKVLGIGAVGLVQMALWGLLLLGLSIAAGPLLASFIDPASLNLPEGASDEMVLAAADISIPAVSPALLVWFVLFFLGGYLLYASLYATLGSAVEQQQDAQTLAAPVTLLVVVPIMFIFFVVESPNAPLSVVLSMIPFFSPILMVVRVAVTEVPFWEVALSYALLIGGFVGSIWICGRIYRIGILMYGKKPSLKDLIRWFRYA